MDAVGSSLVIHALPDDYQSQPIGGSGSRVICGVVR
ncbi:superoxide dismutase family protein [Gluconobacter sp. P1D12_c]